MDAVHCFCEEGELTCVDDMWTCSMCNFEANDDTYQDFVRMQSQVNTLTATNTVLKAERDAARGVSDLMDRLPGGASVRRYIPADPDGWQGWEVFDWMSQRIGCAVELVDALELALAEADPSAPLMPELPAHDPDAVCPNTAKTRDYCTGVEAGEDAKPSWICDYCSHVFADADAGYSKEHGSMLCPKCGDGASGGIYKAHLCMHCGAYTPEQLGCCSTCGREWEIAEAEAKEAQD